MDAGTVRKRCLAPLICLINQTSIVANVRGGQRSPPRLSQRPSCVGPFARVHSCYVRALWRTRDSFQRNKQVAQTVFQLTKTVTRRVEDQQENGTTLVD